MKTFLFLFSLILSVCSYGQAPEWFELGTTWTYNWNGVADPTQTDYTYTYSVTEITEYMGKSCSKIEAESGFFSCMLTSPPYYMYHSNDTVFYATEEMDAFAIGYVLAEGAQWEYVAQVNDNSAIFNVTVESVSTLVIEGLEIPRYNVVYNSEPGIVDIFPNQRSVIEYMGDLNMFIIPFGYGGACDAEINAELRCFSSPSFDYQNPEFTSCTLSNFDLVQTETKALYPNPASESIFWNQPIDEMQVFDALGRLVWHGNQLQNQSSLSVSDLENGMYTVLLQRNGQVVSQKLMINE